MYWFIILFPLLIYPWGPFTYYTFPKVFYLDMFVLFTWLYIIIKKKYWTTNLTKSELTIEFIVLIFMSIIGISTIFSVDIYTSFYGANTRFEGLITFLSYLSILLFSYRMLDVQKTETLFKWMAFVSILVSIYGILQHYSLDFFPRNISKVNETRSFSFFDNANFFGSYLVLVSLITISLYLTAKDKRYLIFYFISSIINFIALIFSGTRSGWIGLFIGVLLMTFLVVRERKYLWKQWSALLISFCLLFITINIVEKGTYSSRLNSFFSDSYKIMAKESTGKEGSSRLFIWENGLPLIKKYYLVGSGPDTFEFVFTAAPEEIKKTFGSRMIIDKAHNEYLQIAITLGLPALLIYLSLLFVILRRAFAVSRSVQGNDQIILYGLISVIFGYLLQAFFNISTVPVAPLFWAILGITLAKSESILKKGTLQNSIDEKVDTYKTA